MTSQKSPAEVFECIDKVIKTEDDLLDSDLNGIIEAIDHVLFEANKDTKNESKKHNGEEWKTGLQDLEKWGHKIGSVVKQISNFCVDNVDIAVDVLETIGECHWAAVGFVLVASVLEKWHTVKHNEKECLGVLKSMNDLAKVLLELRPLRPHETPNTQAKINESIHMIFKGATSCLKMMDNAFVMRYLVDLLFIISLDF
ncbi:uncharacterized protein LOC131053218 [Cryptomeria japonica]|uniref:uncharacterized protein LOC131053218 n=1 Tax=Cryptomeria japonica TaxID=3369 RepID=UPI0027DA9795|nr:uncharacterized protein LOC131053218 [Cryptomeria japonica]